MMLGGVPGDSERHLLDIQLLGSASDSDRDLEVPVTDAQASTVLGALVVDSLSSSLSSTSCGGR